MRHSEAARLTYLGLYALQHRGQESAGIAVSNGRQILVYKEMGLVSQVFDEATLDSFTGHVAVGHCRYSTTGASTHAAHSPGRPARRPPSAAPRTSAAVERIPTRAASPRRFWARRIAM